MYRNTCRRFMQNKFNKNEISYLLLGFTFNARNKRRWILLCTCFLWFCCCFMFWDKTRCCPFWFILGWEHEHEFHWQLNRIFLIFNVCKRNSYFVCVHWIFILHVCLHVHTFLIELRTCTSLVSVAFLLIKFLPLYNSVYFDSFHKSKRRMFFFFFFSLFFCRRCATIYNNYNFQYPQHPIRKNHHLYLFSFSIPSSPTITAVWRCIIIALFQSLFY